MEMSLTFLGTTAYYTLTTFSFVFMILYTALSCDSNLFSKPETSCLFCHFSFKTHFIRVSLLRAVSISTIPFLIQKNENCLEKNCKRYVLCGFLYNDTYEDGFCFFLSYKFLSIYLIFCKSKHNCSNIS